MAWRALVTAIACGIVVCCTFKARPLPFDCDIVYGDPQFLRASPESFSDQWLPSKEPLVFLSAITRSDCRGLRALRIESAPDWIEATLSSVAYAQGRHLRLAIDAAALPSGEVYAGEVRLVMNNRDIQPVSVFVALRRLDFGVVHLGATPDGCPHMADDGSSTTACDFDGPVAVRQALQDQAPDVPLRILLHDNAGERMSYEGPLALPADTWMSAASGVPREKVVILCSEPGGTPGVLQLDGDRIKLNDVTIAVGKCGSAVQVTVTQEESTGGHLIENIVGFAMVPEEFGANGIDDLIYPGSGSTVRNSFFFGYWENAGALTNLERTRIIGNTFVYFQWPKRPVELYGSRDMTIANNVYIGLSEPLDTLFLAGSGTTGIELTGNSVEGFGAVVQNLDPLDASNRVEGNRLGTLEMQSPIDPRFLADADRGVVILIPGEGVSLDGEEIAWRTDILPGAFQTRSGRSVPRPGYVHVGPSGCTSCDVSASAPNEIQLAVWSAWPDSVVKIAPSTEPYAGNVVISWPVKLLGRGATPDEVVLRSSAEGDGLIYPYGRLSAHHALVSFIGATRGRSTIENLTLFLDPLASAHRVAVVVEPPHVPARYPDPSGAHVLRRVRIETSMSTTAESAIEVGDRFMLRDSLIIGGFEYCLRTGLSQTDVPTPTTVFVYNVTCRLTNASNVGGAFAVPGSQDSKFINLALELAAPRPVFVDSILNDTPSFVANYIAVRGKSDLASFSNVVGVTYDWETWIEVADSAPFFVDDDSRLVEPTAAALDSGVSLDSVGGFGTDDPGISLDGVSRAGVAVDCGAYEQGE